MLGGDIIIPSLVICRSSVNLRNYEMMTGMIPIHSQCFSWSRSPYFQFLKSQNSKLFNNVNLDYFYYCDVTIRIVSPVFFRVHNAKQRTRMPGHLDHYMQTTSFIAFLKQFYRSCFPHLTTSLGSHSLFTTNKLPKLSDTSPQFAVLWFSKYPNREICKHTLDRIRIFSGCVRCCSVHKTAWKIHGAITFQICFI